VLTIKGYNSQIQDLQFSTDGRILASAGDDRTVRLWDTATGAEVKILQGYSQPVKHTRFSPDGQLLATTANGGTAKLWQVSTGEELATLHAREGPGGVAFSPDGRLLAWAAEDGIHVWDVRTLNNGVLKGRWAEPWGSGLAFSPDGNVLFSASSTSGTRLWDVRAGGELPGITAGCDELSLSADGRRLATIAANLDIEVWELPDRQKRFTLRPSGITESVALSPDGRTLLAGQTNGVLRVWNAITGQEVRTIQVHPDRTSPRLPGGPYGINRVIFSPDGTRFATAGVDGTAIVWDRTTLHQLMILRDSTPFLFAAAFDHTGRFLATAGAPGRSAAKIWDLATGRELATLSGHGGYVTAVAFSPDGSRLLTGSTDTTVRMWQVPSGQEIMTLRGHSTAVHAIAFSAKGDVFATADGEGVVRLWRVATPQTVSAQLSDPGLRAGLESMRAAMRAPAVEPR
jgi:WD40 repeat protein